MKATPAPPVRPVSARPKPSVLNARLQRLSEQLGVTLKELAPLLQISESTLHRLRSQPALAGGTAERALLLENIVAHGLRVYGGNVQALHDWLRYPLGELDGRTPLQALTTVAGLTQVDDVLGRIEHGVFF